MKPARREADQFRDFLETEKNTQLSQADQDAVTGLKQTKLTHQNRGTDRLMGYRNLP